MTLRAWMDLLSEPPRAEAPPPPFADLVLNALRESGEPMTVRELANLMNRRREYLQEVLVRLERRGYVRRDTTGRLITWMPR